MIEDNQLIAMICRRHKKKRISIRKAHKNIMRLTLKHYINNTRIISDVVNAAIVERAPIFRSIPNHPRSDDLWTNIMLGVYTESMWIESFRMAKCTFNNLCVELQPYLKPSNHVLIKHIPHCPVDKQLAVTLYKLGSCAEYRVIGNVFGIAKSTVHNIFYKTITAIVQKLMKKYITMPNEEEAVQISNEFELNCGLPQIIGVIDGTHIPILPPGEGYRDFINRKMWASVVLQVVVDSNLIFRDISCKLPGRVHDAVALKESALYQNCSTLLPKKKRSINGIEIPYYIIGDAAYPLLQWLMKDFPGQGSNGKEENFNTRLNSARVKVEIAIGRLKGRMRMLCKRTDVNYTFVPYVVAAACVLHNIIESSKNILHQDLNFRATNNECEQPITTISSLETVDGKEIRLQLSEYLYNKFNVL